jgi:hypothetical protein
MYISNLVKVHQFYHQILILNHSFKVLFGFSTSSKICNAIIQSIELSINGKLLPEDNIYY